MKDQNRTQEQLLEELSHLRKRTQELERIDEQLKVTESLLQDTEKKFQSFIDDLAYGYFEFDLEGKFTEANKQAEELTGYSLEKHPDLNFRDVVVQQEMERVLRDLSLVLTEPNEGPKEYLCKTRSGEVKNVEVNTVLIKKEGSIVGFQGTIADITERKKMMEALDESTEKLKTVLGNVKDPVFMKDCDLNYSYVNPALEKLFGMSASEIVGKNDTFLFKEEAVKMREDDSIVLDGKTLNIEETKTIKNQCITFNTIKVPIRNAAGEVVGLCGIARDITKRKIQEEALRESEKRYRMLAENITDVIWSFDMNLNHTYVSPSVEALRGFTGEETKKQTLKEMVTPESYRDVVQVFRKELEIELSGDGDPDRMTTMEIEEYCKDGSTVWVEIKAKFIRDENGNPTGILGVSRDITERKKAREALREMKESFNYLYDAAFEGIIIHDKGLILDVNNAIAKMLSYKQSEMIGGNMFDYMTPNYRESAINAMHRGYSPPYEAVSKKKDGTPLVVEVAGRPHIHKGKHVRLVSVRDITERKKAIEALKENENLYRSLVETHPDAVVMTDLEGKILAVNDQAEIMYGAKPDELIGVSVSELIVKKDRKKALKKLSETRETGIVRNVGYNVYRKDGLEISAETSVSLVRDKEGKPKAYIGVTRDVTEKRKMEEELIKASKLESLGFLAGGIAHDFNNILTAILGNVTLAKMYGEKKKDFAPKLEEAERAIMRAKSLTQQLMTFSRGGAPIKESVSIVELIRETCDFALAGSNIKCDFDIQDRLWALQVDPVQISQVLNNLTINAKQAMPNGGDIRISLRNTVVEPARPIPVKPGNYVKMTISDTGEGIPEEIIDKIFDPYFTTKKDGSGLGLTTTYSIIKRHDGHIEVDSEKNKGATFNVYLPATDEQVPKKKTEKPQMLKGKGKILLMDDEEIIRKSVSELLESIGYNVECAPEGSEALDIYEREMKKAAPFDAVIVDLTVPGGMGGKKLFEKLREIDPTVKALVSSGHSRDPVMSDFKKYGFSGILHKPYRIEELSKVLAEILKTA